MPFYSFRCDRCGFVTEREFRLAAAIQPPNCLECDLPMRRKWDTPGIAFKGNGWGKDK